MDPNPVYLRQKPNIYDGIPQQLRSGKITPQQAALMASKFKAARSIRIRKLAQPWAKRRWTVLFTVVKMNTVYRRVVAKRRRARQIIAERVFVMANFVAEVVSAVLDQLSSHHKTHYCILAAMLIAFAALFICISELVYRGRKARVSWQWRNKIPWFYYPSSGQRPFGSVTDIIGLVCAILQFIFNAIAYVLYRHGISNPIQLAVMPLVFAFCLMCSKIHQKNCENDNASTQIPHSSIA